MPVRLIRKLLGLEKPLTNLELLQRTAKQCSNPTVPKPPPPQFIPHNDAIAILETFDCPNRDVADTGIALVDLEDRLSNAGADLVVDWRSSLQDVTPIITDTLDRLRIETSIDLFGDDLNEATIHVAGKTAGLKYVPRDEDDFDSVIVTINSMIQSTASFRKFRSCEGTDGWCYAALSNELWARLDSTAGDSVDSMFVAL